MSYYTRIFLCNKGDCLVRKLGVLYLVLHPDLKKSAKETTAPLLVSK
jgi:hypothetical protein